MKNSSVRTLVLDDCGLTSEALKEWVVFFQSGTNTTLRHLSLAGNQIGDDGAEALGAMLQAATTQNMHFDLRGNNLSTQGLHILSDAMKNACPTSVTTVQVADNQDDDEPEAEMYRSRLDFYLRKNKAAIERETLRETIKKIELSSLELVACHFKHIVLTIAEADSLGAALQSNHSVVKLRLEDNALPEEGARRILRALRTNRSVRTLALVDNNIGDGGFRELSELLRVSTSGLRAVIIANPTQLTPKNGLNVIGPRTGSDLHYTFAHYALLTSLSLANCGLDDLMVSVLVSGIAWGGRIEALDLQRNSFGDRSVHVLARMLQRCLCLYRLDLLRMLLLGRFLSCEQHTMDQIIDAAEQSRTLVQLELITTHRRSSTSECIASLNTRLRAARGVDFEQGKQQRKEQVKKHEKWCRQRALVHQEAVTLVRQLARHTME
ncbi:uncharacterized protein PITG_06605 [Phytophthora infestans T30-4]|uniref:Myosin-like protein n=1 Tax=Phytophthora infestans (strain T30-4) TaxID=403677 RepID=D0N587_PHYIT|nr:uncharacterized protein PITG_06605 [Phytophthora infestans T30-4]EEY70045.1 conserved hypothetical protein [Phytophthora infestans T30-4]|eukprot:XP_002998692.1 conserved hypothetical protein [Phytophthora infestans T30-4]